MLVHKSHGVCHCGGQIEILEVDDVAMDCECTKCGDDTRVEIDAFKDGGVHYWPMMMAEQESNEDDFEEDFFNGDSFE